MKKTFSYIIVAFLILTAEDVLAQQKNTATATVTVYGNCGMCKATIEKAGTHKKEATVVWNQTTKLATLTYNPKKTNQAAILKCIALAGYDNELFLAPEEVYANLHECCQYERETKNPVKFHEHHTATARATPAGQPTELRITSQNNTSLRPVFEAYFAVKDALVQSDGAATVLQAKLLLKAIEAVPMQQLTPEGHKVWMEVLQPLSSSVQKISATTILATQRSYLNALSEELFLLAKVTQLDYPVFLQHCPMANQGKGAHWLSQEKTIKNPYYGATMLRCGSTIETLQ